MFGKPLSFNESDARRSLELSGQSARRFGRGGDDEEDDTGNEQDEFRQIMEQQADRVAELFGHKEAWSN